MFATAVHIDLSFSSSLRMAWSHRPPLSLSFTLWWSKETRKLCFFIFYCLMCKIQRREAFRHGATRHFYSICFTQKGAQLFWRQQNDICLLLFIIACNLPLFLTIVGSILWHIPLPVDKCNSRKLSIVFMTTIYDLYLQKDSSIVLL